MTKRTEKQKKLMWAPALVPLTVCGFTLAVLVTGALANPSAPSTQKRIFAQALVENTLAKHPGLAGVGLATVPPEGHDCVTIADTDAKELGDKCDKGEVAVMKTGKPTVEKEGDGYDVTLPLHVSGKSIGIIGMDFKLDQEEAGLLDRAKAIAKEMEDQISSKAKLFEPAK
jgi:hypothetical protein